MSASPKLGSPPDDPASGLGGVPSSDQALLTLALESWKFVHLFTSVLAKLDPLEAQKYRARMTYFVRRMEEALQAIGARMISIEGQEFDGGMAATALNAQDFSSEDRLVIDQVIEPLVMSPEGVLHPAVVSLRKAME